MFRKCKNIKLFLTTLLLSSISLSLYSNCLGANDKATEGCSKIKYVPKNADETVKSANIDSVDGFSLAKAGLGWSVYDHIGYKDTAFQGERHVAWINSGLQFFGYDREPLSDLALIKHPEGENQTINTVQAPIRADWHTLNGNGVLFGCTVKGTEPNKDYNTCEGEDSSLSITGYSVVATLNQIEVRQYNGVNAETIGENFTTLYAEPKRCPGQNITVEITGGHAKVFLDKRKIYEFNLSGKGRYTGLVTTYQEHCCPSLSSIYMFNHTVNGVNYLDTAKNQKKGEK